MNSISSVALSGLNAAQRQLSTSAHNVANASTEGFRRQVVELTEQVGGGVTAQVTRIESESGGDPLAEDLVNQLAASNSFEANLKVLQNEDRRIGSLLDILA